MESVMRAWVLLVGAVLCGAAGDLPPQRDAEAAVRARFEERLNDPEGARFVFRPAVRFGERVLICGTVNARNRYGGYDGPTAFMARFAPGTARVTAFSYAPGDPYSIVRQACQEAYGGL